MNDVYREFKVRLRKLEEVFQVRGRSDLDLAQALSRTRRAERHGDRSREPSSVMRAILERAEALARGKG